MPAEPPFVGGLELEAIAAGVFKWAVTSVAHGQYLAAPGIVTTSAILRTLSPHPVWIGCAVPKSLVLSAYPLGSMSTSESASRLVSGLEWASVSGLEWASGSRLVCPLGSRSVSGWGWGSVSGCEWAWGCGSRCASGCRWGCRSVWALVSRSVSGLEWASGL